LALGEIYRMLGDLPSALSAVNDALRMIDDDAEKNYWADVKRLKAEILLAQSNEHGDAAESLFQEAMEIAARQEARLLELRAAVGLARHWRGQDRTAEAYKLLAPIYGWFTEGFDTPDLKDARELIDDLK
jgi:predicted ATPase